MENLASEENPELSRSATLVICKEKGVRSLLVLKSKSRPMEWEIPGGEVIGLPTQQDADREVLEETGLRLQTRPLSPTVRHPLFGPVQGGELIPEIDVIGGSGTRKRLKVCVFMVETSMPQLNALETPEHSEARLIKLPDFNNPQSLKNFYQKLNSGEYHLSQVTELAVRRYLSANW